MKYVESMTSYLIISSDVLLNTLIFMMNAMLTTLNFRIIKIVNFGGGLQSLTD